MSDLTPEEKGLRAAEYVLRLLDRHEEAAFEQEMMADRSLQADVAAWVLNFEGMNAQFAEIAPRKSAKSSLMERLFGESAPKSVPFFQRIWLWQTISFAALALAAYVSLQSLLPGLIGTAPQPIYVSEIVAEDNSLRVLAVYDPAAGGLKITRTVGGALDGRVLELWAIRGDNAPVSLGVLPDSETAAIHLPEAFRTADGLILAISDEPTGGSPTGAPTGAVLALGETHEI